MQGKLLIFSAPSGSGKTSIVRCIMQKKLPIEFSISACSRSKREGEVHGKDYYFLSVDEFKKKIANDEFLEWEEVYEDNFYGTLKSEVDRIWQLGNHAIFDIDVEGGMNLKKQFGDRALLIFIMPPSIDELEKRLKSRSTDSESVIKKRVMKAKQELSYSSGFDKVVVNNVLKDACEEVYELVKKFVEQ